MKENLRFAASSLTAGACIGIAAMVYLQLGGLLGSVMFAFGLLTVVYFRLNLFTGKSQYVWPGSRSEISPRLSALRLIAMLLLNIAGCALMACLAGDNTAMSVDPGAIIGKRLADGPLMDGLRAIPCGFIMTLSVRAAGKGNFLPLLFGVPTFIICSFPHCIADVFYYTTCPAGMLTADPCGALAAYLSTVVGNYLGCNIYRSFVPFSARSAF